MVESPCPTWVEATNVVNVILDGTNGVLLGAKTLK
jgi:pyruvate kinase